MPEPADTGGVNVSYWDRYTLVHVGFGALLGAFGAPGASTAAFAVGWELLEPSLKEIPARSVPETLQNAIVDVLAVGAGWWLATRLRRR